MNVKMQIKDAKRFGTSELNFSVDLFSNIKPVHWIVYEALSHAGQLSVFSIGVNFRLVILEYITHIDCSVQTHNHQYFRNSIQIFVRTQVMTILDVETCMHLIIRQI